MVYSSSNEGVVLEVIRKKTNPSIEPTVPRLTRHVVQPGDPVWVRIGQGECAAKVVAIHREFAIVKFVTGAREKADWTLMRFRIDL